jgi:hypothetical protein
MGVKLLWTGITFIIAVTLAFPSFPQAALVGAVIMVIGCVLMWLDK